MIISWNTTKRCNLYCEHCYRDSSDRFFEEELTTEEGKKLIDEIARAGFKILILSGGEPLIRDDIYELISYVNSVGMVPVLGTNGTLISREVAKKLKQSGLKGAGISIDYLDREKHDRFRGSKGSLDRAIEGIENCLREKIRVQINTTVTKRNRDELFKISEFAEAIGASSHHPFLLVEVGRGKDLESHSLEDKEYMSLLSEVLENSKTIGLEMKPTCGPQFMSLAKSKGLENRFSRGCLAGVGYCCILPNGDVHICPYLQLKVDSVRDRGFDSIWRENAIFNRLRDYDRYGGNCGECEDVSICGGCRARAYGKTGDYMAQDPYSDICKVVKSHE